jgi:hypothetical protein
MYRQVFCRQNQRGPFAAAAVMLLLLVTLAPPASADEEVSGSDRILAAADSAPTIELTSVPAYGSMDPLRGRVTGVSPSDYRVAVYIQVPPYGWWSKPTPANRVTLIQPDGTWECDITTADLDEYATQVAAFLIPAAYPPPLMESHECLAEELKAYPQVRASRYRTLMFANCDWMVRTAHDAIDPGPNYFSDSTDNVSLDTSGLLHMKIVPRSGTWYCSGLSADRSLGYGRYAFTVTGRLEQFDPNVVLAFFTWEDCQRQQHNREMDIEISRWSNPAFPNTRFAVQPWYYEENQHTFNLDTTRDPNATTTHEFIWEPDQIRFRSYYGRFALNPAASTLAGEWTYAGPSVPTAGQENIRINLYLANQLPPADRRAVEVRLDNVLFLPATPSPVYRFWSPTLSRHFYTIKTAEKEKVEREYASVWTYEGVAYYTAAQADHPDLVPVYRFWSDQLSAHFYTAKEAEKDKIIATYPDVWTFEGPAFYAWPDGKQPPGTVPIYRFWSGSLGCHFYTAKEGEKQKVIDQYPDVWTYEGIAWHAYSLPQSTP